MIWVMTQQLVGPVGALVAILIIDGLHYFTFTASKFNHDVIQLPFWAVTGFAYWAALRGGRTVHWALLGLGIGMAVWAKYFVVVQAVPLVLFALFDRNARKSLATLGPWIAGVVALPLCNPSLRSHCTLVWALRRSAGRCCDRGRSPRAGRKNNRNDTASAAPSLRIVMPS